ncbi:MAG: ATP-binding protein [Gammaproteobacteria bacterium]|nr:ATP-binding protein [Gammaproteobacteria bacterium]MBU1655250.1 ATP-binding protein [Gammaproteobacteria bacterium]MBU1959755.1 ATP-binding protein [Gammaproteobacteria bacterium]
MIPRDDYLSALATAVRRSPVCALLGPRQCGKTTLARMLGERRASHFFDLESEIDRRRLQNPELMLGALSDLVILDEIQNAPELFSVLRVLADRRDNPASFLILGSASPQLIKGASETLAGRVEFIDLSGFDLTEIPARESEKLWLRGGFPRSFLADSEADSLAWREGFIRTFLERDIPQLGITIPASAMRRFWTMLAHLHGQTWNASELGRSLGLSDKTVRSYLDILTGTYMVRQLQPWHENIGKRQVKAPKIYLRDSGLLHNLLGLQDRFSLLGHPRLGASWEGFALEQVLHLVRPEQTWFWATHSGAELDLLILAGARRYGVEFKFSEAPGVTKSMHSALNDLGLAHLWVVHPGPHSFPAHEKITMLSLADITTLPERIGQLV